MHGMYRNNDSELVCTSLKFYNSVLNCLHIIISLELKRLKRQPVEFKQIYPFLFCFPFVLVRLKTILLYMFDVVGHNNI